jgi:hypothetical protein
MQNVRNFWCEVEVDGRSSKLASGPVARDGGIECEISIRRDGQVDQALRVRGVAHPDGTLELVVTGYRDGQVVERFKIESAR